MDWDDLRIFLAVSRCGGLLPAARRLGVDHTTVARRLTALETAVGERLIERSTRGATLTVAGAGVLDHVERMETEALALADRLGAAGPAGVVRLATPEAFGAFLVAPSAHLLHKTHPELQLELVPEARAVNLSKREADMAVTLARPTHGRLFAQKLADYRLGLYASRTYLAANGPIESLADLRRHPLVWYIDELLDLPELRYLDQIAEGVPTAFRSTSIVAQQAAVASGLGIGVLHAFAADHEPHLQRVLVDEVELTRSYWLVVHADQRNLPRIRAVSDFLRTIIRQRGPAAFVAG